MSTRCGLWWIMADSEEPRTTTRGSETSADKKQSSKGKASVKRTHPETSKTKDSAESVSNDLNNNLILECLKNIQQSQSSLVKRIDAIEQANYYEEDYIDYDDNDYDQTDVSLKRKNSESEGCSLNNETTTPSRFTSLSKKFKSTDICSEDIDSVLADDVSDLFMKGMDEDLYEKTVKDENCPRPGNCEGLTVAKMNKLVWDVMTQQSRSLDRKMQMIATSIVKAGVFLAETMDKAAKIEIKLTKIGKEGELNMPEIIEGCHSAIALMGHANYQVNMTRRDLLRPELKREYSHLCTHSLPVTKELFGDDVSKTAREIEDFAKIGSKLSGQPSYRGGFKGRSGFRGRFRGSRGRGYMSYGSQSASTSRYGTDPKNFPRRGGARNHQK